MKALKFVGDSQADLTDFPVEAKRQAGFELWQVQLGLMPPRTSSRCRRWARGVHAIREQLLARFGDQRPPLRPFVKHRGTGSAGPLVLPP